MDFFESVSNKWKTLTETEQSGLKVLIIFVLGVLIFSFGIGIGDALYSIFGN
jgi:hypothetical protein